MKILKTDITGGQPTYIEDLGFIQDNVREITSAISKGLSFGNNAIKLYGAVVTLADAGLATANYSVTAGAIWYNDEVYFVPTQVNVIVEGLTQGTLDSNYYWNIVTTESNQVLFDDGLNKNTYSDKTMALSTNNAGILNSTTKTLQQAIPSIQYASTEEIIAGTITDKYVSPLVLGRQGESFVVTFPAYTSSTTYYGQTKYINGYQTSVEFTGSFLMSSTQPFVDLTLNFPFKNAGLTSNILLTVPTRISASGLITNYVNLIADVSVVAETNTVITLRKPYLSYRLSGTAADNTFAAGETYYITFKY